jgi:hypothetical protein
VNPYHHKYAQREREREREREKMEGGGGGREGGREGETKRAREIYVQPNLGVNLYHHIGRRRFIF